MKKNIKTHVTPLYRDVGYILKDSDIAKDTFDEEIATPKRSPENYIYTRYRNPTVVATEEKIMALEECSWALLTSSGMSAIDVAISTYQKSPDTGTLLFFSEIYGGTNAYIDKILVERRGLAVERFDLAKHNYNLEKLEALIIDIKPTLLFFEAISNPLLTVSDGNKIIEIAKKYQVPVIVDNTFATAYLWKPLSAGADMVIHSASKYLGGHGNITAGVVCGNDEKIETSALEYRKFVGNILSPDDAHRLADQLITFDLRMEQHCENAMAIAEFLNQHSKIEKVLYPGLESHTTHSQAKSLFQGKGFGSVITFELAGDSPSDKKSNCDKFIEVVADDIPFMPTMGEAKSILIHVETVFGSDKFPFPGMIRFSVGIEPLDSLKNIIENGLNRI